MPTATDTDDSSALTVQESPTALVRTPLETELNRQWYGNSEREKQDKPLPWLDAKSRARERLDAFAAQCGDPPSDMDRWIAELPAEWMIRYVIALRTLGKLNLACQRTGISYKIINQTRQHCPAFEEIVKECQEAQIDSIEGAAIVSATVGDPEPVFDKGVHVGYKRVKSIKAAELLLGAKRPHEYRKGEVGGATVNIQLPSSDACADVMKRIGGVQMQLSDAGSVPHAEVSQSGEVK